MSMDKMTTWSGVVAAIAGALYTSNALPTQYNWIAGLLGAAAVGVLGWASNKPGAKQ